MQITFAESQQTVKVEEGTTLQEAAVLAGLQPDAPCGGKGTCRKCSVWVEGMQEAVLACQTLCRDGMVVHMEKQSDTMQILRNFSGEKSGVLSPLDRSPQSNTYAAAFDIGTTTIAAYLLDKMKGIVLMSTARLNPQIQHGADVISRIEFAGQGGAGKLTEEIRNTVNEMLKELADGYQIHVEDISVVSVAGNTCMNHFFLGVSTNSLVRIPYQPAMYEEQDLLAAACGIRIHPQGRLLTLPNIAGFVGGDTVACMIAADYENRERMTLLVDIGTNGEMVLGNAYRRVACSTAAGPALEGAKISCGMRGTKGAIDHVWLENDRICFSVLGDGKPKGICGSGLLDAVSVLLNLKIIDETGAFLNDEKQFCFSENVCLTQRDIRELQLAKGAIAAGIRILCKYMELDLENIAEVLIAGAFGNYMDADSACRIGMIPSLLRDRIQMIGNAAGEGSCQIACSQEVFQKAAVLARETEFVELASDAEFQDIFVEELEFGI